MRSQWALLGAIAASLAWSASANAYVLLGDKWAAVPVHYTIDHSTFPASLSTYALGAIEGGFATWAAPDCSGWSVVDDGDAQVPVGIDGKNTIVFVTNWPQEWGTSTLGLTIRSNGGTGSTQTFDADIAFNAANQTPSTDGAGSTYDLISVATHEEGHFLGMAHSPLQSAVMYATYQGVRRSLDPDDAAGVCALYPKGATDSDAGVCAMCAAAAKQGGGQCAPARVTCGRSDDCIAYTNCSEACHDSGCEAGCESAHATGYGQWHSYINCLCQDACSSQCASECTTGALEPDGGVGIESGVADGSIPAEASTPCEQCSNGAAVGVCASQRGACANSTDCVALAQCVAACNNSACSNACANQHTSSVSLLEAYYNCICDRGCQSECSAECGPAPDAGAAADAGTACDRCANTAATGVCSNQRNACAESSECLALVSCVQACTTSACQNNCAKQHPTGVSPLNAYDNCICNQGCHAECSAECAPGDAGAGLDAASGSGGSTGGAGSSGSSGGGAGDDTSGGADASVGGDDASTGADGSLGSTSQTVGSEGGAEAAPTPDDSSGCSCETAPRRRSDGWAILFALGAVVARRRHARQRRRGRG